MNFVIIGAVAVVGIIIVLLIHEKIAYIYYTIEVWGEVPLAQSSPDDKVILEAFPEEVKGPNLRKSLRNDKWQIGRESRKITGGHCYKWQTIGKEFSDEIFRKISLGEPVKIFLKDSNNEAIFEE